MEEEDLEGAVREGVGEAPPEVFGAEGQEEWDGGEGQGEGRQLTPRTSTSWEEMGAGVSQDVPLEEVANAVESSTVCVCTCMRACMCVSVSVFDARITTDASSECCALLPLLPLQAIDDVTPSATPSVPPVPLSPPWIKSPSPLSPHEVFQSQLNGQEHVVGTGDVLLKVVMCIQVPFYGKILSLSTVQICTNT